jgi:hypothetical protein
MNTRLKSLTEAERHLIGIQSCRREFSQRLGGFAVKRVFARLAIIGSSITALLLAGGASRVWK